MKEQGKGGKTKHVGAIGVKRMQAKAKGLIGASDFLGKIKGGNICEDVLQTVQMPTRCLLTKDVMLCAPMLMRFPFYFLPVCLGKPLGYFLFLELDGLVCILKRSPNA